ncbi:MAG: hypothetical protein GXP31_18465 [Kiritimatiellaeota bacterium]|nr:hypothetical protein [Kiritimatiellota bacterium]
MMRPLFLVGFLVALSLALVRRAHGGALRPHGWLELIGRAARVVDGNNFRLLDGKGVEHQVRLLGAETPELSQPYGLQAKKFLEKALADREVRIVHRFFDGRGRLLGRVYVGKQWINLQLVEKGLAWARPDSSAELRRAMEKARVAKMGLWSREHPIPPWFWRRGSRVYREGMEDAPLPREMPYAPSSNDRVLLGVGY